MKELEEIKAAAISTTHTARTARTTHAYWDSNREAAWDATRATYDVTTHASWVGTRNAVFDATKEVINETRELK